MTDLPNNLKYSENHVWAKKEGEYLILGLTKPFVDKSKEFAFVELPNQGDKVQKGEEFCTVESVKSSAHINSPVDGEVIEVNEEVLDEPPMLNEAPYENWLIKVKPEAGYDEMLDADSYAEKLR